MISIKRSSFLFGLLTLLCLYLYNVSDIPKIRTDDGFFYDGAYRLMTDGMLRVPSLNNGHFQDVRYHGHPPLYFMILGGWFTLFGSTVLSARLCSTFLAILTVFIFFKLMKQLGFYNKWTCAFVALVTVSTPLFYIMSRTLRPEIGMTLGILMSIWLYHQWLQKPTNRLVFISGICLGLTSLVHYYVIFIGLLWGGSLLYKRQFKSIVIFGCGIGLVYGPYCLWLIQNWSVFYLQFQSRFPDISVPLFYKIKQIVLVNFSVKSLSISMPLWLGLVLLYWNKQYVKTAWLFVIVSLYYLQFLILPIVTPLHMLPLGMLAYLPYLYLLSSSQLYQLRYIYGVLIVCFVINILGILYIIQTNSHHNYSLFSSKIQSEIPQKNVAIMGPLYMTIAFKDYDEFVSWESYDNGFISFINNAEDTLIKRLDSMDYALVDDGYVTLHPKVQTFLNTRSLSHRRIYDGDHGYYPVTLWTLR